MTRHDEYLRRRAGVLGEVSGGLAGGAGDPVVLLPGFGGGLGDVDFLAPMLARRHRVLALELPDASFEDIVARVIEKMPDEPATLVGSSFGALVAIAVAERIRVVRLVLLAGWLAPQPSLSRFARLWLRLHSTDPESVDDLARLALLAPGSTESGALPRANATVTHLRQALAVDVSSHRICAPTLVLAGAHDAVVPREQSEALFGSFEDGRFATLDTGHALLLERPAEALALIESFLAGTDAERMPV